MFCLEYLGAIYYRPHRDFNANIHFLKKTAVTGLLYGTLPLPELKDRKIAVLGTGEKAFLCTQLLLKQGITVDSYCDNDPQLVGRLFDGKPVLSPFTVYGDGTYYVIAAPDDEKFEAIADQFTHCDVKEFSYFFTIDSAVDLAAPELREPVFRAINCLINIPYGPAIHKNAPMGITMRLLPGLEWWSEVVPWLYQDLKAFKKAPKILDIGPGFGFVSMIIKMMRPDAELHWLNLSVEDREEAGWVDPEKKYPVVRHYGMIEDPQYQPDGQYDLIIMTEVFEHFASSPDVALRKIAGLLAPDGSIYLTTPNWERANFYESWRDIPPFPGDREAFARRNKSRVDWADLNLIHTFVYREEELRDVISASGLKIVRYCLNDCNNFNLLLKAE